MKQSAAQAKATQKWEKANYWKFLVRFKKEDEAAIRAAAGDSLNSFVVRSVLDAVKTQKRTDPQNAQDPGNAQAEKETPESENAQMKWYAFPEDMIEEMQKYGDPAEMLFDGAMAMLAEYRAGLRS